MRASHVLRARKGFTLPEVLITVATVGILAAIAIPNLNLGRVRANAAMRGLGSTLMAAQRQAIIRQHDVIVRINTARNVMTIHLDVDDDATVDSNERFRAFPLGEGIVFGRGATPQWGSASATVNLTRTVDGLPSITFHRNGSASENGGFYVVSPRRSYGEQGKDARYLEISRATGRVSWHHYAGTQWKRGF
jgi:prepilin-type N-terminal cleavage/methylation domain-containing protein